MVKNGESARQSEGSISAILSKGDITGGHRSREQAEALLPDFRRLLKMAEGKHKLDKAMLDFIVEVVLGAAWYQRHCARARWEVRRYILLNCLAVIGLPILLMGLLQLGHIWNAPISGMMVSQITGVLTGILSLQKTLAAWYSSQQRFAAWYKSAADLKTLYYSFIQKWEGNAERDQFGCRRALTATTSAAREIIASEQLDYFQKLSLPSFDILDMLTSTRSTVSAYVTSLLPGAPVAPALTEAKNSYSVPALSTTPPPVLGPTEFAIAPGGPLPRASVYRVAPGQVVSFNSPMAGPSQEVNAGASPASNWITYASCNTSGESITALKSTWVVPAAPALARSQTIFLFNGAQTSDGNTIVQPVLQWGDSFLDQDNPSNMGPFWTIATWVVSNGVAHHVDHQPVSVGQTLTGSITLAQQSDSGYVYNCEFEGIEGTQLQVTMPAPLVNCVQVLEAYEQSLDAATRAYDLFYRQEYPNTAAVAFTGIDVTVASSGTVGIWKSTTCVRQYNERTDLVDNSATNGSVSIVIPLQTA